MDLAAWLNFLRRCPYFNDMTAALSIANWPLQIMCMSSILASTLPTDRNDLKR
jgi:hypothetical protein